VAEPGSVVITGASRGLGLASAVHLYGQGWTVVAAVRSPDAALERLRAATAAAADDPRLLAVRLDLDDHASVEAAARAIGQAVGAPDAVVHNAGVAAVGCVEELPASVGAQIFSTNFFGPVRLTQELLPSMRAAGRGRIVVVSSQGGVRGMPAISAYSAAKGALERWAEALSPEVAPFGIGVTVLVAGTFKTDILELTQTYADLEGPYAAHHAGLGRIERWVQRLASPPGRFAPAVARAVKDRAPFVRHAVGPDAHLVVLASRLLPARLLQRAAGLVMGLPPPGTLRGDPARLTAVTPRSELSDEREASG
jgi:NAD(P)-dependent dehydrogenase (short-subunit alcohol dehydrogenase family)